MKCNLMNWWALVLAVALGAGLPSAEVRATMVDFEDLSLASGSYENGAHLVHAADGSGSFSSRGVSFNNYFDTTYGPYWEGWAASKVTDTSNPGVGNQCSAVTGGGYGGPTSAYGVAYQGFMAGPPTVTFSKPETVTGAFFTNTAWAYSVIVDGDPNNIARQFHDGDYFLLTITGIDSIGSVVGHKDFYLADYQSASHYAVNDWTWVDLTGFTGKVSSLQFALDSTDSSAWGINTPAYFAIDNLTVVPEPGSLVLLLSAAGTAVFVAACRVRRASRSAHSC